MLKRTAWGYPNLTMKWSIIAFAFAFIQVAASTPVELSKRSSYNDVATVGYAAAAGTTGGSGGTVTTVTSLAALTAAVSGTAKKIVVISGTITGSAVVKIGANTSVIGLKGSQLAGIGLRVLGTSNVIIRNIKITKVLAEVGDAIGIESSQKVWIDHTDLSSDKDHDKDFYDGLLDITHGCTGITATGNKLSNHFKGSLIGASDSNTEDINATVTYANNYFLNIGSRTPSFRFGHGHIFNNLFETVNDGINTRVGAQLLVENNVFVGIGKAIFSTSEGFAVARGNDFGGGSNTAPVGTFTSAPYAYSLLGTGSVRSSVSSSAGQTLTF